MKKAIVAIIIILIILTVIGVYIFVNKKEPELYITKEVSKGDISQYITASGTINPLTLTVIGSQISGPIKEIYVDFNTKVVKGQLLALIDPELFEARVSEAKANVESAEANLQRFEAILVNNERIMNRNKELFETDLIAKIEFENAETDYLATKAELYAAEGKIAQAKAQLNNALTNLKYTRIVSPTSGIVISKDVEVGQTVAASFQTPTLFTVAEDLTKMQIEANVSEADISKVKVGQKVKFDVDSYPGEIFHGTVSQIRNSPETIQNVVTYYVIIDVNNNELKLKPGMTANVSILTSQVKDAMLVPKDCLRFTPFEKENMKKFDTQGIWILKGTKPVRIPVKIGISNDTDTVVYSDKLQIGDKVIVSKIDNANNVEGPNGKPRMRMRFP